MNKLSFFIWAVLVVTFTGGAVLLHDDYHRNLTKVNEEVLAGDIKAELPAIEPVASAKVVQEYTIPDIVIVGQVPGYARRRK